MLFDFDEKPSPQYSRYLVLLLAAIGLVAVILLIVWSRGTFSHSDKFGVIGLVKQVQADLAEAEKETNDERKKYEDEHPNEPKKPLWRAEEVELEVNFVTTIGAENKADLTAVSNTVSSGHQDTHRLLLKMHRMENGKFSFAAPNSEASGQGHHAGIHSPKRADLD